MVFGKSLSRAKDRCISATRPGLNPFLAVLTLLFIVSNADAWEPRPGWRDSYAVDGMCYCDSSNYDHGIGKITVPASDGYSRSVQQICEDIKSKLGVGAKEGRIPYNTIACGNAPANDAVDEDLVTGCPGRVDLGNAGCFDIGPKWPLDKIYGLPVRTIDRSDWQISASDNQKNTAAMADGNSQTRWTTNRHQTHGQWLEIDLGALYKLNVVDLETVASRHDFPVEWLLEVSVDGQQWSVAGSSEVSGDQALLQRGEITRMRFSEARVRHLRITQTGQSKKYYWSVHELTAGYLEN